MIAEDIRRLIREGQVLNAPPPRREQNEASGRTIGAPAVAEFLVAVRADVGPVAASPHGGITEEVGAALAGSCPCLVGTRR